MIIYCITNKINNKQYIGSTINKPNIRFNQHKCAAYNEKNLTKYQYPLYQAFRKYGLENFSFEVLENFYDSITEEQLRRIEKDYISKYNTLCPNGYNQTIDTEHPINDTQSYYKMGQTKRELHNRVAEVDQNFNIIQIWRSMSDCAEDIKLPIKAIGACCRCEKHSAYQRYFYYIDDNDEIIIPEKKEYKGEQGTTQTQITNRKVAQIDINTNNIINTYDSIALASRETGCDGSGISKVCRGVRKTCGGFKWQYI